ncbi:hypothetical protein [Clavibacter sp. B3I6]|uniref:hypothetical protein n=1 Tax=Clavibacter sp. B3I6 TaxID=3042268 RepID=UPI0027D78BA3|nr:hypothetical protein [Clavibacter sp. B3I6]
MAAALVADWEGRAPQPRHRGSYEGLPDGWRPYEQQALDGPRADDPRLVEVADAEGLLIVELASAHAPDERFLWVVDVSDPVDDEHLLFSALWGRLSRIIGDGWQETRTVQVSRGIRVLVE